MGGSRWNQRFLSSTRGQIVALLRRGSRTVNELAEALGLTDNAVRAHLAGLERDGLVEQEGVRRGIGKPAHVFELTAEAEGLFPKAYAFMAVRLVEELRQRVGEEGLADALRAIGQKAGEDAAIAGADPVARLGGALAVLEALGSDAELQREDGRATISGHTCPLSSIVAVEPRVCGLLEGFLEGATGATTHQHCEHGPRPRCRFELELERAAGS